MQPKYTRGKPVDKERLAQYLDAAKGPGRTMKQFAEECNVNPSTLSRIANKKLVGASSESLMMAIFEHADPNSGITLDALMDANGMVPVGSVRYNDLFEMEKKVTSIITSELMRRVSATICPSKPFRLSRTMGSHPDIVYESDSFGGNKLWAFDVVMGSRLVYRKADDSIDEQHTKRRNKMMNIRRFFERLARYTALHYFHLEEVPQRFTYVLLDKDYFEDIISEYGEQIFKGYVSLLLVDANNLKILDEFIFPHDGENMGDKFFTIPPEETTTNDAERLIDIDDIRLN